MGMHGDLRTELVAGQEARAVRRKWPDEVKAQLFADSYAEGAKAGDVVRLAGLHPSHLSMWMRQAREGVLAASEAGGAEFAEMVVAQEEAASEGWIEIEHGGTTIRFRLPRQVGDDEAHPGEQLARMPLDLGNDAARFVPTLRLILEIHVEPLDPGG